jgi:hypothetical protein
MGRECSMNVEKRNVNRIWRENQNERDHEKDQDVGGWTI